MSSLAVGRGLEYLELWLGGRFTAAELAAADLLLQLSVGGAGGADEAAESSSSATTYSSRRSAIPCLEDFTAEEERVVEERALPLPLGSVDLDRRARKRYRLLSELYAATAPVTSADSEKKRKAHHHSDVFGSSSSTRRRPEATRYGGDYYS